MPIIVEPLTEATYQDQQDLQKIYRDAPHWLFAPFAGDVQLIEGCLRDGSLIAGRFNDRLLGAGRLTSTERLAFVANLRAKNHPSPWRGRAVGERSAENGVAIGRDITFASACRAPGSPGTGGQTERAIGCTADMN